MITIDNNGIMTANGKKYCLNVMIISQIVDVLVNNADLTETEVAQPWHAVHIHRPAHSEAYLTFSDNDREYDGYVGETVDTRYANGKCDTTEWAAFFVPTRIKEILRDIEHLIEI